MDDDFILNMNQKNGFNDISENYNINDEKYNDLISLLNKYKLEEYKDMNELFNDDSIVNKEKTKINELIYNNNNTFVNNNDSFVNMRNNNTTFQMMNHHKNELKFDDYILRSKLDEGDFLFK